MEGSNGSHQGVGEKCNCCPSLGKILYSVLPTLSSAINPNGRAVGGGASISFQTRRGGIVTEDDFIIYPPINNPTSKELCMSDQTPHIPGPRCHGRQRSSTVLPWGLGQETTRDQNTWMKPRCRRQQSNNKSNAQAMAAKERGICPASSLLRLLSLAPPLPPSSPPP